jgi:cardiolipin synthase A/B
MALIRKNIYSDYKVHNRVSLIRGGEQYFTDLKSIIRRAVRSIHLQTYIYEEDETGEEIAMELIHACGRGVQVYILLDGYASRKLTDTFINRFKEVGIHFRFFEPVLRSDSFYFGRRLHHKVLVADAQIALVAGVNISNKYNDMPGDPAWLDWAIMVEGEAATDLYKICVGLWVKFPAEVKRIISGEMIPVIDQSWNCPVRVRRNDWVTRKNEISRSYLEMFNKSNNEIIIMSSYFLPGRVFRKNLSKAVKRGVNIKLILAGASDVIVSKQAERYMYRWLFKNGIEIYEYPHNILHGKLAVYDGIWVTGGSYNVNNISAYASIELNLDIKDSHFAKHVCQILHEIIHNDCVRITEDEYKISYNFFERVLQYISYEIVRLIFFLFTFYFRQR